MAKHAWRTQAAWANNLNIHSVRVNDYTTEMIHSSIVDACHNYSMVLLDLHKKRYVKVVGERQRLTLGTFDGLSPVSAILDALHWLLVPNV